MTNIDALKSAIEQSGLSITYIAEKTGIARETMYNRFKTGDFKLSEIDALTAVLRLGRDGRDSIFFAE